MIWPRADGQDVDDFYEFEPAFAASSMPLSRLQGMAPNRVDSSVALGDVADGTPPSAQRDDLDFLPLSQVVSPMSDEETSSPAWSHRDSSSPCIPSAQPYSYPFSLPSSGIRPLTPISPLRTHQSDENLEDSVAGSPSSKYSNVSDSVLETVIQGISRVQVE